MVLRRAKTTRSTGSLRSSTRSPCGWVIHPFLRRRHRQRRDVESEVPDETETCSHGSTQLLSPFVNASLLRLLRGRLAPNSEPQLPGYVVVANCRAKGEYGFGNLRGHDALSFALGQAAMVMRLREVVRWLSTRTGVVLVVSIAFAVLGAATGALGWFAASAAGFGLGIALIATSLGRTSAAQAIAAEPALAQAIVSITREHEGLEHGLGNVRERLAGRSARSWAGFERSKGESPISARRR